MKRYERKDVYIVFQGYLPEKYAELAKDGAGRLTKNAIKIMGDYDCIGIAYHPIRKTWGVVDIAPFSDDPAIRYGGEVVCA